MTAYLSENGALIERHWQGLILRRRAYSLLALTVFMAALFSSLWYANDANSGKFFDRLPHLFDFMETLAPRDIAEIGRAMFNLPSPYDDGSLKYQYVQGRYYIAGGFYIPGYFYLMLQTVNIALVATLIGAIFAFPLSFLAARNLTPNGFIRLPVRRFMELLRAFPEVVITGFILAIFSIGPFPAMVAVGVHTIGALGKLFFEVVENADMKPEEGLKAVGASWVERVSFAMVPQVLPNFISYCLLRFEINVRASTIIGAVGGGGIGEPLRLAIGRGDGAKTIAMVILLLITVIAVDQLSAWARRKVTGDHAFTSSI